MRERLKNANGTADHQMMLVEDFRYGYYSSTSRLLLDALKQRDQWLAVVLIGCAACAVGRRP